jgi:hypothetical protein
MDVPPAGADNTSGGVAPQPEVEGAVELLMVTPAGKLSITEKFVRFVSPGALMVIRNLELLPAAMVAGENDFEANKSVPRTVTGAVDCRGFPTP